MIKFDTYDAEGLYSTSAVINPSRFVKVYRMGLKTYSICIILAVALVVHLLLWVAVGMLDMWVLSRSLMSEGSSMFSLCADNFPVIVCVCVIWIVHCG